jgi:hypothetical protein
LSLKTRDCPVSANVSYDAGTFTATLDPSNLLSPGTTYTATVKAGATGVSDQAGNHLGADRVWSFTAGSADTTPPETTIDSGPSGTTNSSSASFGFSSSESGSSFECSLDAAAFGACTSPAAYSGLADGGHNFQVRATDGAGNTDPTPASRSWTIDTLPPAAPQITSPADNSIQSSSTVALVGNAESGASVALLDGQTAVGTVTADLAGSWQRTLTGVGDGAHAYTAVATDAAGNNSPASTVVHVTVDTAAPQTTIDSGPSGTTSSSSASFSFSSSENRLELPVLARRRRLRRLQLTHFLQQPERGPAQLPGPCDRLGRQHRCHAGQPQLDDLVRDLQRRFRARQLLTLEPPF